VLATLIIGLVVIMLVIAFFLEGSGWKVALLMTLLAIYATLLVVFAVRKLAARTAATREKETYRG